MRPRVGSTGRVANIQTVKGVNVSMTSITCKLRPSQVVRVCGACQKSFITKKNHVKRGGGKYCSRPCMAEAYRQRMKGNANPNFKKAGRKICLTCNQEYISYVKTRKFCSVECCPGRKLSKEEVESLVKARAAKRVKVYRQKVLPLTRDSRHSHTCKQCGKLFNHYRASAIVCSIECSNKWQSRNRVKRECIICAKSFSVAPSTVKYRPAFICSKECHSQHKRNRQIGERSHRWKGGLTAQVLLDRQSLPYKQWRTAVFQRDDFTCQLCNVRGGKLSAHHIKEYSKHPELRLAIDNGICLCWPCHIKINGREHEFAERFVQIISAKNV